MSEKILDVVKLSDAFRQTGVNRSKIDKEIVDCTLQFAGAVRAAVSKENSAGGPLGLGNIGNRANINGAFIYAQRIMGLARQKGFENIRLPLKEKSEFANLLIGKVNNYYDEIDRSRKNAAEKEGGNFEKVERLSFAFLNAPYIAKEGNVDEGVSTCLNDDVRDFLYIVPADKMRLSA